MSDANIYVCQHCLLEELGPETIGVMKAIKDRLDP